MNLEPIIQSEVSQKEKYKYHTLMHIYEIQKTEFIFREAMQKETQKTDLRIQEEGRRERVRCMERVTWKSIIPYVKQIANGNLLYDSGNSKRGSMTIQKGGVGREMKGRFRREGTWVYLWLILVDVRQKTTKFCKAIILQLKNLSGKKREMNYEARKTHG